MKKALFFLLILSGLAFEGKAQSSFKLERVDSIPKTKSQIYSDTKMFIAENWKSAQNVIQNDDKETGVVLVKGMSVQSMFFQMNDHKWTYSYTVKFLMKEGKYKIVIENVSCVSAICGAYNWPLIEFCDNCEFPGYVKTSLSKDRWSELIGSLKSELTGIADKYEQYIKLPSQTEDW